MNKVFLQSTIALLLSFVSLSSVIVAASGVTMIGPASGLAHTGVGGYQDVDAMLLNPAWMGEVEEKSVFKIGMALVEPDLKSKIQAPGLGITDTGYVENKLGTVQLPHIGYILKLSDTVSYGFGMFAGGGAGADYTDAPTAYDGLFTDMNSFSSSTGLVNSISVKKDKYRFGFSADYVTGVISKSMNATGTVVSGNASTPIKLDTFSKQGDLRYVFGAGYEMNEELQFGLSYRTKLALVLEKGTVTYQNNAYSYSDAKLDEPGHLSAGLKFNRDKYMLAADAHYIFWEDTVYGDFGWENGTMLNIAGTMEIVPDIFTAGLGYSFSSRVTGDDTGVTDANVLINTVFTPSNLEHEFSAQGRYSATESIDIVGSLVYIPESKVTQTGTVFTGTLKTSAFAGSLAVSVNL